MTVAIEGADQWPPSWQTLSHGVSSGRYTDPEFAKLEYAKMWNRVWQFAARVDELPEVGDQTTYDIGDQSVLLVRAGPDTIKAFYNVCPHRGTALSDGAGHFVKNRIICPFHGWKWDLHGCNQFVMERQEFCDGNLQDSDVALREVHLEIFAGFIFICLDPNPQPFAEYIAPVGKLLEALLIGDMHYYWWKSMKIAANWKVAQEAFFEAYHVPATHPQLDKVGREVIYGERQSKVFNHTKVDYDAFPNGHGRFYAGAAGSAITGDVAESESGDKLEDMIESMAHLVHEMDAMVLQEDLTLVESLRGKPVPEGSSPGAEMIKLLYTTAAQQQRPMPVPTPEVTGMWGGMIFIFPNLLILPNLGNVMIYRIRPDGLNPDSCTFEIYSNTTYPAAKPVPRAKVEYVSDTLDPEQLLKIPRQDFMNIPRMQKGMHSIGFGHTMLASHNEKVILNMHQHLDRYLTGSL
jgi:phenylpropionate dioxygenase-like ring-hydroxylating dioxygenase large terminal subunit